MKKKCMRIRRAREMQFINAGGEMAAFASGIFNHAVTAAQAFTNTNPTSSPMPEAAGTDGTSNSSTSSATISANDFLTLLVTEMKNQDPTANTDPNQYINQLVNVNSLEQLIQINQNLSTALGNPASKSGTVPTGQVPSATSAPAPSTASQVPAPIASKSSIPGPATASKLSALDSALKHASGNLTVPDAIPAAHSVANALGVRPHGNYVVGETR
jgi:flagellar basal-body rod modification protein FlgD